VIYNLHTANKHTLHIIGFVNFNVGKPIVESRFSCSSSLTGLFVCEQQR